MRSIPLRLWALAIVSSLLQILPFPIAGPVPLWRRMFCWFCLTPLLLALTGKDKGGRALTIGQAALLAYVSGLFWYMGNCYWIYQTMHIYGELPGAAAAGILVLFSLYVALYHGLFGGLMGLLRKRFSVPAALWLTPLMWVAVEFARARITAFPWDLLGYTQVDQLLVTQLAPWTGVLGLSFVVALVNVLWISGAWSQRLRARHARVIAGTIAVTLALALRPSPPPAPVSATALLLQENLAVGTAVKIPETTPQLLTAFTQLSLHPSQTGSVGRSADPTVVVWPEAPADFRDADPVFLSGIRELARQTHAAVIANDVSVAPGEEDGHYHLYNSAVFISSDGRRVGRYDKMHLVPFGEYTPYKSLFSFAGHLLDNLPFVPGEKRSLFAAGGKKYGVFICYESIFGDDIRRFVLDGAQVLVNISDDGWYGDSSAPWEHLDMVRMRAIENRRWVIRATNTGVTAAIDPLGRIMESMPRHVRGSMLARYGYSDHLTFYARHGDWFGRLCSWIAAGAVVAALFAGKSGKIGVAAS